MEIILEILELVLDITFRAAVKYEASRWKRLVAHSIVFLIMSVLFLLSYIFRADMLTMGIFIFLGCILAITLVKSFPEIRKLIRNEEE